MKMIKGFLFVLIGFAVLITLVSLLMPSNVMTANTIMINAPKEKIAGLLSDLNEWKSWHPLFNDTTSRIELSSPASGVNASAKWNTNGKENTLIITESTPSGVRFSLKRTGENEIMNMLSLNGIKDSSGIQVEWVATSKLKWYPWEKFAGIFFDKVTGPGYKASLEALKEYAEK
jgi:hypothetical protein